MPPKELIRYLQRFDPKIRELALDAREMVLQLLQPSNESVLDVYVLAMNYGFSERMKDQVVYIGVYERHINLGFHWGARLDDPARILKGEGKQMRHIQIHSRSDLGSPMIRDYLERAVPEGSLRTAKVKTKIYPSKRTPAAGTLVAHTPAARTSGPTVDDYLAPQPATTRAALAKVRTAIRKALPKCEEVISYKMPTYKLGGETVIHFAAWKQHYSLYAATASVVATFQKELSPYKIQKGTISFPWTEPVPVKLIERIAKFRAKEVAARL